MSRLFVARFVPDLIPGLLHGPVRIVLERAGEVASLRVPIDKQGGRNEALRVVFQVGRTTAEEAMPTSCRVRE